MTFRKYIFLVGAIVEEGDQFEALQREVSNFLLEVGVRNCEERGTSIMWEANCKC